MEHEKPPEWTHEYKHPGSPNVEDSSLWIHSNKSLQLQVEGGTLLLVNNE